MRHKEIPIGYQFTRPMPTARNNEGVNWIPGSRKIEEASVHIASAMIAGGYEMDERMVVTAVNTAESLLNEIATRHGSYDNNANWPTDV